MKKQLQHEIDIIREKKAALNAAAEKESMSRSLGIPESSGTAAADAIDAVMAPATKVMYIVD